MRRISHYLVALVIALAGGLALGATAPAAHAADRDCGDFSTQAAAQKFYIEQGGPQSDSHGLDDDGDGVACESNPCPCSTAQGGGGGGGGDGAGRKKAHVIRVRGSEIRDTGTFQAVGNVPTYRGKIQLQRNTAGPGGYKLYKRGLAKRPNGKVSMRFDGPHRSCFRVMVPETKKFRKTFKRIGCIAVS